MSSRAYKIIKFIDAGWDNVSFNYTHSHLQDLLKCIGHPISQFFDDGALNKPLLLFESDIQQMEKLLKKGLPFKDSWGNLEDIVKIIRKDLENNGLGDYILYDVL